MIIKSAFWSILVIMSNHPPYGIVAHEDNRATDYLYRISLKCIVHDQDGRVLVVKETGRNYWDLPGGGMDHGEDIKQTIARELLEEVGFTGEFEYQIIDAEEPKHLQSHNFWQIRLIYLVTPTHFAFSAGQHADEIAFMDPLLFKDSAKPVEQLVYHYSTLAK